MEFSVDTVSVSLNISLTPPVSPYGDIVVYQVVVLREPPLAGEDPLTLNLLKETELQVCVYVEDSLKVGMICTVDSTCHFAACSP